MGSVSCCNVKDCGAGGEMMRYESVIGMLCWGKEEDKGCVRRVKGGEIGEDWVGERGQMEAGVMIHGVFF